MGTNIFLNHPYWTLSCLAFFLNIPCGYIRESCRKFSMRWWLWIHATIPLLIVYRIVFGTSKWFIPVGILLAVFGQVAGSRLRRQSPAGDWETMEQIPDLRMPAKMDNPPQDSEVLVALMNMGGPRTIVDVKPFLLRLFSDSLIIHFPGSPYLQSFWVNLIVNARYKETEKRYGLIGGGTPLYRSTESQVAALTQELKRRGRSVGIIFSFNYSEPLPEDTIREARSSGKKFLLPLSLYPHYSLATTGSNLHYLKQAAAKIYPELRFLKARPYYLDESYIAALLQRIREQVNPGESLEDFYLLFSAHGTPLYFQLNGDPYAYEINQTVAQIVAQLGRKHRWALCFQSAVGPMKWLKPTTEAMIKVLASKGIKKVLVVPVAFVSDHIETICEIDIEYRKVAEDLGISDFRMSRAVECHPGFIKALADCVEDALGKKSATPSQIPETAIMR